MPKRPARLAVRTRGFELAAGGAWHQGLVTPASMARYADQHRGSGRPGLAAVNAWLRRIGTRQRPAMSRFELDVIEAMLAVGLPPPERQYPLVLSGGRSIHLDIAWPDVGLAVEPGHSWWHGGDERMRADAQRDRSCSRLGWLVMRFDEEARADLGAAALEVSDTYNIRAGQLKAPRAGQI
jgi:hypothetical protein